MKKIFKKIKYAEYTVIFFEYDLIIYDYDLIIDDLCFDFLRPMICLRSYDSLMKNKDLELMKCQMEYEKSNGIFRFTFYEL